MLKINLSDTEGNQPAQQGEDAPTVAETSEQGGVKEPTETEEVPTVKKRSGLGRRSLLVMFLVVVIGAGAYYKMETVVTLIMKLQTKPKPLPPVTPPPQPPAPEEKTAEYDPVFLVLTKISEAIPPKVWLTSASMKYNGSYDIKGIAFIHGAMDSLNTALGTLGTVTKRDIPAKSKFSETVYTFGFSGAVSNVILHDILDVIPSDSLAAIAEPVVGKSKELGVRFIRSPKTGETYSDKDTPFVVEGPFDGVKKVIGELCPEGGDIRVYQLSILPAERGRFFDRVKASFSLRIISKI